MSDDLAELLLPVLVAAAIGMVTSAFGAWMEERYRSGEGIGDRGFLAYFLMNTWWVFYGAALAMMADLALGEFL